MSTHKHFDKICCVVLAFTLIITVLFVNAEKFGIKKASNVMEYENTLFDKSKVHTIDIIMDDWDEFTDDARSEEYYVCSVVIDNEAFKNVAIRGKGNTSLSSVTNGRYSYKIEFDHYDSTTTYYGLDKLCLNNIVQDNTYMKDYITYTLMSEMGVASPLCSYVYVTVNGEDWGLYLAVEGVEESFLKRNYGKNYGELYKPDSISMGGGRGNGDDFEIDAFMNDFGSADNVPQTEPSTEITTETEATTEIPSTQPNEENTTQSTEEATTRATEQQNQATTVFDFNNLPEGVTPPDFNGELPEDFTLPDNFNGQLPEGFTLPDDFNGELPEGFTLPDNFNGENPFESNNPFSNGNIFGGDNPFGSFNPFSGSKTNGTGVSVSGMSKTINTDSKTDFGDDGSFGGMTPPDFSNGNPFGGELPEGISPPTDENGNFQMPESFEDMFNGSFGGFGGLGSSDVKLQYIDDDADSYQNIFENAKTDVTKADKKRLIESLENLSNGEDLENTVNIEEVIRYFVVHNFVVNSDSYTGAMIHNYYLYEKDGQLQMIPWDYNLAFGSFMSTGSATRSVNDPIDSPLSVSGSGDRPMIDWIFSNEEYTELYHKYFNEFIEDYFNNGYFEEMIDSVKSMISPYVEKDPTKFCTYEEFETGVSTLKEFCLLRAESVKGQLAGTIGSTSDTQKSETLIDAGALDTSTMGSMGGGMGGFGNMQIPQDNSADTSNGKVPADKPSSEGENTDNNATGNNGELQIPDDFKGDFNGQMPSFNGNSDQGKDVSSSKNQIISTVISAVIIILCILILVFAILFVSLYKRRKS